MKEDKGSRKHVPAKGRVRSPGDEGRESSLAERQLFSGVGSKQSQLAQEKTPKGCIQDCSEIDRLPKVFELTKRRLTTLLEGLGVN